jgi:hypothetical protein
MRTLIKELTSPGTRKFVAGKKLLATSEKKPEALYPHFDALAGYLCSENKIIRWAAIRIIANLASVDRRHRMDGIINEYLAPIAGPAMITAANTIIGAAKIANAQPHLVSKVVRAILKVERARYQTDECRNIAIGHAIVALGTMAPEVVCSDEVVCFVERQRQNTRSGTQKKAEVFLKKLLKNRSSG